MNNTIYVYLAGPIAGCTDAECKGWRTTMKGTLVSGEIHGLESVRVLDPMERDFRDHTRPPVRNIVDQDKDDIRKSNVVLAYCPKPTVGTSMEILYANLHDKFVVVVIPEGKPVSPWIRRHANAVVTTFDAALFRIAEYNDCRE